MSSSPGAGLSGRASLRAHFARELQDFASDSSSKFRVLNTIPSLSDPPSSTEPLSEPRTLYILDSSFNPPTRAHLTIAQNALMRDGGAKPARMVFLLATENADKKSKPASFEDRLVMMSLCAEELRSVLRRQRAGAAEDENQGQGQRETADVSVDVAVTKNPFFMDKAISIDEASVYLGAQQVHLTGYDTIIRIFDSKYYPADQKLRVLEPFLSKHRLRVCYRVGDAEEGGRKEQEQYVERIADGSREEEGMRSEWRRMVELVDDAKEVEGVSSTEARKAALHGDVDKLRNLVSEGVAEYVMAQKLYEGGESVKKS